MTANEKAAITKANNELISQFGTAKMRNGGARSYLWFDVYNKELGRLNDIDPEDADKALLDDAAAWVSQAQIEAVEAAS